MATVKQIYKDENAAAVALPSSRTGADTYQEKQNPSIYKDSKEGFRQFTQLPHELKLMILQERLTGELASPIRTLISIADEPSLFTMGTRRQDGSLWYTGNNLIRDEIERRSIVLPARQLTHPGDSTYHMDRGLCSQGPASYQYIGTRPISKDALCYMDYNTAFRVFERFDTCRPDSGISWAWLTNLLLDYRTFRALLEEYTLNDRCIEQPSPFRCLSGLKVLYLGFARRWTEVVLVEGHSAEDILINVEPVKEAGKQRGDPPEWRPKFPDDVLPHAGLEAMISSALQESAEDVLARDWQGIALRWVVVKDKGITRRRDVIRVCGLTNG